MKPMPSVISLVLLVACAAIASAGPITDPHTTPDLAGKPLVQDTRGDDPARPVPEPGTMALASMGLIALGAAIRKARK